MNRLLAFAQSYLLLALIFLAGMVCGVVWHDEIVWAVTK